MLCESCGKNLVQNTDIVIYVKNGEDIHTYCRNCSAGFGSCSMCAYNIPCGFFNDPDPMPQFVMLHQERRTPAGVQVIQKKVPNAERIKKFCINGKCSCYNGDDEHPLCCRFGGYATCSKYSEVEY